ncbi:unnamed protein product, partial [Thlaspi arvense]
MATVNETKSYLYNELWRLCAGPLFDLPKLGGRVYYFPQGYIQQLEISTNSEFAQMQPLFDIPSKIPCNVIGIQLKEVGTPIPIKNQENPQFYYFIKVLSASDTNPHGGLSVPKSMLLNDMSHPIPTQEIVAKDLHGREWRFKHIFRGTLRIHLFTTGWNAFVTTLIGTRRVANREGNIPSLVISSHSMHQGVIASAKNAMNNKCMFIMLYKPRSSQFIVGYEKNLDAVNNKFSVDTKFTMLFKDDDFNEK